VGADSAVGAGVARILGRLPALAGLVLVALTAGGCASEAAQRGSPTPSIAPSAVGSGSSGSLTLTGALTGNLAFGAQRSAAGCPSPGFSSVQGANDLEGEVDFGSGFSEIYLEFAGVPGANTLPFSGETTTPGPRFVTVETASGDSEWYAGQMSPTSSGTLTLSSGTNGSIRGSVDATLAPLRGSSQSLHVSGTWDC